MTSGEALGVGDQGVMGPPDSRLWSRRLGRAEREASVLGHRATLAYRPVGEREG
jgi:hypothetical protein